MKRPDLQCVQTGCTTPSLALEARDRDDLRAKGVAAGWYPMARKGGKLAWYCPAHAIDESRPAGEGLTTPGPPR